MPNFEQLDFFLEKYFPGRCSDTQKERFKLAFDAYIDWNSKINVISRKDMENLAERHFLHSLALAKALDFKAKTKILDVGTGGGFPGIPLAILFPEAQFHLLDSIKKKIRVVQEIVQAAEIENVQFSVQRAEQMKGQFDFVISRAVAPLEKFVPWVKNKLHCRQRHALANGILYLRGEDALEQIKNLRPAPKKWSITALSDFFEEPFFLSKNLVHLSFCK